MIYPMILMVNRICGLDKYGSDRFNTSWDEYIAWDWRHCEDLHWSGLDTLRGLNTLRGCDKFEVDIINILLYIYGRVTQIQKQEYLDGLGGSQYENLHQVQKQHQN